MHTSKHWICIVIFLFDFAKSYNVHEMVSDSDETSKYLGKPQRKGKFYDLIGLTGQYGLHPSYLSYSMPFYRKNYASDSFTLHRVPTPHYYSVMPYMIPVSDQAIEQIVKDPVYQNKLTFPRPAEDSESLAQCKDKRGQVPSPKSCSSFLNCWDGWAIEQDCPKGLLFSEKGYCDYPEKVDCKNRRQEGSTAPVCKTDFDTFRSKKYCGEFFVCVNREPIMFQCPSGLFYREDIGVCDYKYNVDCEAVVHRPSGLLPIPSAPVDASPAAIVSSEKPTMEQGVSHEPAPVAEPGTLDSTVLAKPYLTPGFYESLENALFSPLVAISKRDAMRQLENMRINTKSEN